MKKFLYMAVAAIAVLSSCDKANNIIDGGQENAVNAPVFTATINPGTKTTIAQNPETGNYTKVNWESGDEVVMMFLNAGAVMLDDSEPIFSFPTYVATPSVADASTATLSIKAGETYNPEANLLAEILYPLSVLDRKTNMLSFPATQVYKGDNKIGFAPMVFLNFPLFDDNNTTMPENIQMQNACALLQITVPYSEMHEVRSITVSSDLQMNGAFSIDSDDDGMFVFDDPSDPDDGENQITLDCYSYTGSNVAIPEGGSKTFYISIVARENVEDAPYFKYLNIDVTDGITTKTMRTKTFAGTKGDGIEIKPNVIYPFTFKHNQTPTHAYVDLGLSVKWATVNVGATTLEGFGDYFAWGATEPLYEAGYAHEDPQTHWKTGKSAGYCWNNTPYQTADAPEDDDPTTWTKYLGSTTSEYMDESATDADAEKTVLDLTDDAASANWGGSWRMPTREEWLELSNEENCTWTETTINGIYGYKVQSNKTGYTDKWIFLPAAGYRGLMDPDDFTDLVAARSEGYYWSSSLYTEDPSSAWYFSFDSGGHITDADSRYYGHPVRPVCE